MRYSKNHIRSAAFGRWSMALTVGLALCTSSPARAESESSALPLTLPPIIKEGSVSDALSQNGVLQSEWAPSGALQRPTLSGAPTQALTSAWALPARDPGTPGGMSQLSGAGRSAEELSVQVRGVPLNSALGGGAELSVFPQFLWSGAELSRGPVLGSLDPRATGGVAQLELWTDRALDGGLGRFKAWGLGSTGGLFQLAVSGRGLLLDRAPVALVAGVSQGRVQGPSAAVSVRAGAASAGAGEFKVHVLGTSVQAQAYPDWGMPGSHARTTRVIPVLENRRALSGGSELRSMLFYDGTDYAYYGDATDAALQARNLVQVGGARVAWVSDTTLVAASGRLTQARASGFEIPLEGQGQLQAQREWRFGEWSVLPALQAAWISQMGVLPQASLGARWRWIGVQIARAARVPSLTDRFYVIPGFFNGNPALRPEGVWSAQLQFTPIESERFDAGLTALAQHRTDAVVATGGFPGTVINGGDAQVASVSARVRWQAFENIEIEQSGAWNASRWADRGGPFPLLPAWVGSGELRIFGSGLGVARFGARAWQLSLGYRTQSDSVGGALGGSIGGFTAWHLRAELAPKLGIWNELRIWASLENLTDRSYEVLAQTPALGRALVVGLQAGL